MKTKIKIICEYCDKDHSDEEHKIDHFVVKLKSYKIPKISHCSVMCYVIPPLEDTLYFCGLHCLKNYLSDDDSIVHLSDHSQHQDNQ